MTLNDPNPNFKVTHAEYLRNGTHMPYSRVSYSMSLSDLIAKYSMTLSMARFLCDRWACSPHLQRTEVLCSRVRQSPPPEKKLSCHREAWRPLRHLIVFKSILHVASCTLCTPSVRHFPAALGVLLESGVPKGCGGCHNVKPRPFDSH